MALVHKLDYRAFCLLIIGLGIAFFAYPNVHRPEIATPPQAPNTPITFVLLFIAMIAMGLVVWKDRLPKRVRIPEEAEQIVMGCVLAMMPLIMIVLLVETGGIALIGLFGGGLLALFGLCWILVGTLD